MCNALDGAIPSDQPCWLPGMSESSFLPLDRATLQQHPLPTQQDLTCTDQGLPARGLPAAATWSRWKPGSIRAKLKLAAPSSNLPIWRRCLSARHSSTTSRLSRADRAASLHLQTQSVPCKAVPAVVRDARDEHNGASACPMSQPTVNERHWGDVSRRVLE